MSSRPSKKKDTQVDSPSDYTNKPEKKPAIRKPAQSRKYYIVALLLCVAFALCGYSFIQNRTPQNTSSSANDPSMEATVARLQRLTKQLLGIGVRVPGTPGHIRAQEMIISEMRSHPNWKLEFDSFVDETPIGSVNFTNIIADFVPLKLQSKNQNEAKQRKRIIFAAHYESKLFKDFEFLGATDSAVPVVMMLEFARYISERYPASFLSKFDVQLVFFDGEEAFVEWEGLDNTYGARHLAARWEKENNLKNIEALILLDLIGGRHSIFRNFFPRQTGTYFGLLSNIEREKRSKNLLQSKHLYFDPRPLNNQGIEDDHIPFLKRGVPIVHLIAAPFPSFWHTPEDNYEVLHWPTIADLDSIFKSFIDRILGIHIAKQ